MLFIRTTQLISKHGSKQHSSSLEVSAAPPLGVSGRPFRQQGLEQPGRMNRAWDWNGWKRRERALLCAAMATSASILDWPSPPLVFLCPPYWMFSHPLQWCACHSHPFSVIAPPRCGANICSQRWEWKTFQRGNVVIIQSKIACVMKKQKHFLHRYCFVFGIWHSAWQP